MGFSIDNIYSAIFDWVILVSILRNTCLAHANYAQVAALSSEGGTIDWATCPTSDITAHLGEVSQSLLTYGVAIVVINIPQVDVETPA